MAHTIAMAIVAASGALLLCFPVLLLGGQQADPQGAPSVTFRAGVETVVVRVTARDRHGRLITTLGRDDFQLLIDGRPVTIEVFSKQRQALSLGILLHPGYPVSSVARIREIGRALVDGLESSDQAFIGTFGLEIAFSPFMTSNRETLHRVLREEVWPSHGMNLIGNAVETALSAMLGEKGKRALAIVGDDAASCDIAPCLDDALARRHAVEQDVTIYGIVVRASQPPLQVLGYPVERMANATGGGYLRIERDDDAGAEMSRVVEELRHEYLLGFTPIVADNQTRSVSVRVAQRGVRVVTRLANPPSPK